MCEFCKNIKTNYDYETLNPYLFFGAICRNDKSAFHILVPTDDGIDYSIDNIEFCPMCGRNLTEE